MITKRKRKIAPLNLVVHLAVWIPLIHLIYDGFAGNLSVNPIQDITFRTGKTALIILVLSLACTPVNTVTGLRQVLPLRRPLGLYAFMYASLHFIVFSVIDYGADLALLREAIFEKPYALVGFAALLTLIPLALTSTKESMRKLGPAWKKLHRLVYAAGLLVILHYSWVVKGDVLGLRGNILQPLIYGLLVGLLLLLRLPPVKRWIIARRPQRAVRKKIPLEPVEERENTSETAHSHLSESKQEIIQINN